MVIYDVRYAGRNLFYRLALSDMNIPYADPRHPFHKKSAFDLGDAGAGTYLLSFFDFRPELTFIA